MCVLEIRRDCPPPLPRLNRTLISCQRRPLPLPLLSYSQQASKQVSIRGDEGTCPFGLSSVCTQRGLAVRMVKWRTTRSLPSANHTINTNYHIHQRHTHTHTDRVFMVMLVDWGWLGRTATHRTAHWARLVNNGPTQNFRFKPAVLG